MNDYHNTNKESGTILDDSIKKAKSQQEIIVNFMTENHNKYYTPEIIKELLFKGKTPLTSIRRAMTNLKKEGILVKTDFMTYGNYGKKVHLWRISGNVEQPKLF